MLINFFSDEPERPASRAYTRASSVVYERPSRPASRGYGDSSYRSVSSSRTYHERPYSRTSYTVDERPGSRMTTKRSISYSSGEESPTRTRRTRRKVKLENYIISDTGDFNI